MSNHEISRRSFLKAFGATTAALMVGTLPTAFADNEEQTYDIVANYESDVVVVGAGISGLAAAVQAAQLGLKVILLEAHDMTGGNGLGTEGLFGCGSAMQKEAGIEFTFGDIIKGEAEFFNYRINADFWRDMVNNSADNIKWAVDNGVELSGKVDNYYGMGLVSSFHWFKDGSGTSYTIPMTNKALELGVDLMYKTRGMELKTENGSITGIYAQTEEGMIEIDSKTVILASGGYAGNDEILDGLGFDTSRTMHFNLGVHLGDGLRMAKAVGGADVSAARTYLGYTSTPGSVGFDAAFSFMQEARPAVWINNNANRFVREDCGKTVKGITGNAVRTQELSFCVVDSEILQTIDGMTQFPGEAAQAMRKIAESNPDSNAFSADSLEELAALMGVDPEKMAATIADYNEMCSTGVDTDFGKDPEYLIPISKAPFYAFRQDPMLATSIGGIHVNRNMEVIDLHNKVVVKGLYAVGTDSCEQYRETYTISIPASCQGNNLNSGRTAAKNAAAYITSV